MKIYVREHGEDDLEVAGVLNRFFIIFIIIIILNLRIALNYKLN